MNASSAACWVGSAVSSRQAATAASWLLQGVDDFAEGAGDGLLAMGRRNLRQERNAEGIA